MPSQSPKKTMKKSDDALLAARIDEHKIEYPRQMLLGVGVVTSFLPAYMAHAFFGFAWTSVSNVPVYALVIAATGYMLSQAYSVMFESEFLKRQKHWSETKTEHDAKVLRNLRLQVALGYAIFFINALFVGMCTLLQAYIFRRSDHRAGFLLSPTITAAVLWFVALKNEEARQRRVGRK